MTGPVEDATRRPAATPGGPGPTPGGPGARLADVGEEAVLAAILPLLQGGDMPDLAVVVGPGDDAALLEAPGGRVLATTDALVRDRDWRDEWSSGADVGGKAVAQNVADVAAMGGVATALLVTLVADPQTSLGWVLDLAAGLGEAAREAGVAVVGGDLSSAPAGTLVVCVTALGRLSRPAPVCRSGARPGDVVAVAGSLGRSAAGLLLLQTGREREEPDLAAYHRRPRPPYEQGPRAAAAGATAMIDVSDGLLRDAGRVAGASGVEVALDWRDLERFATALVPALTPQQARQCVLGGGEEHSLLGCFPRAVALPRGWRRIGSVRAGGGVTVDGERLPELGWDHFGG